ncbi:MAG TPA: PH domain-containing protein [Candidatus Polarisedimenticolaceae bacterium]
MYESLKAVLLRLLKVPPEPHAPSGSPGSVKVFRAGRNYYRYKLVLWAIRQLGAVVGAVVVLVSVGEAMERGAAKAKAKLEAEPDRAFIARHFDTAQTLFEIFEIAGVGFLLVQMPFTFAAVRLDYEMRWYVTTDRSLRIREGIVTVREMTLTFGNVQNVSVRQGPLQRLLGLADVVVETAGGGGSRSADSHEAGPSLHEGYLRGVDNAEAVRDAILERLRRLKDAGLGDPEDPVAESSAVDDVAAAREVLDEVRALRRALATRS